jgi:activator of Hsp90 ATPase protein 1
MPIDFTLSTVIATTPEKIFDAWVDAAGHSKMTGGKKANINANQGAEFSAWNGHIRGQNLVLDRPGRIVQKWRNANFFDSEPDSRVEVLLAPAHGGTRITVRHSDVPDRLTDIRDGGWRRAYFEPMKKYFGEQEREGGGK